MSLDDLETELGPGEVLGRREVALARSVGADPAAVRIHRGPAATQASAQHGAVAFAAGNHIVIGSGAPVAGTPEGDELLLHEAAHVAQQQDAARDPVRRRQPIGREDQMAERDADRAVHTGLASPADSAAAAGDVMRTGPQLQRWPFPQQTPNNIGARSLGEKAAFIRKSMGDADEGWSRVVVDVFEQTDPASRIALQRQLDMEKIVKEMPDFEATRLGTLGPLTAAQATLNKKRAAYIEQAINDFGDRAEVFVLFAFRGVYDDDAYTIFAELANRRYLHKLLAMPDVAKQIKARGLKTDGFGEPGAGVLGAAGEMLGGLGAGIKHMVKDDRPGEYGWQKHQMPREYAGALSQMEMDEFESGLTPKNAAICAIDQVTFGVPHGVVDLGRNTISAIGDIAHGEYRAAGEKLSGAAVVLLTHLGVKAWRVISSAKPRAPATGGGTNPVDNAPGVKGPEGPGQFVIPSFEGPITAQEAKLGAIFELNPEAQAAMGRLIARVGRGGVERVADLVQTSSRAALFVAEHGEAGVYALLEAEGDVNAAAMKLPSRQLATGESTRNAALDPSPDGAAPTPADSALRERPVATGAPAPTTAAQQSGRQSLAPADVDASVAQIKASPQLSGDMATLEKVVRDAKSGQGGALGELEAVKRWISLGKRVEVLPETQNEELPTGEPRTNPDYRVDGVVTEIKTRTKKFPDPGKGGKRSRDWIKREISEANKQIRNSKLTEQGQIELQLRGDADMPLTEIEQNVRGNFNSEYGKSLQRVAVYREGQLVGEWRRNADGTVTRTFPSHGESK
jgi:hypothetical protein